jgi:hypothetical protein
MTTKVSSNRISRHLEVLTSGVETCLESFRELLALDNYPKLSIRAYSLRSTEAYFQLKELIRKEPDISAYRHIRHYLGRLASWAKSTHFVVDAAKSHRLLTRHVKVRYVQSPSPVSRGESATEETALQALVAALTRVGVPDARRMCNSRLRPLLEPYAKRWRSLGTGTTVHAEVIMLDHFYHHKLTFAYGKRYIGCSKPSCFCCGIYMSNHPLQPQERQCHNNVWIRWSPPQLFSRGIGYQSGAIDDAMGALAERIRQNIKEEMSEGRFTLRQRVFDSITDISTSLPTVFDSMIRYH